jgi:hypothetical protein
MAELIEKLVGDGRVLNGETVVAQVRYEVRSYQRYTDSSHLVGPGLIPVSRRLECDLFGLPKELAVGERLTLVLNDGRKVDFYVWAGDSIRITGGIYS